MESLVSRLNALVDGPHFNQYTLDDSQLNNAFVLCAVFIGAVMLLSFPLLGHARARYGWVLSTLNSGLMSLVGALYLYRTVRKHGLAVFYGGAAEDLSLVHGQNDVAMLATAWFIVANLCDLVLGFLLYPMCMDILTGYIHHSVFVAVLLVALKGDGLFFSCAPYAAGFAIALIEEVPTFVLALSSLFPSLQGVVCDALFGVTFVLFRILHHAVMLFYAFHLPTETIPRVMWTGTFIMHIVWFRAWCVSVLEKRRSKESVCEKEDRNVKKNN